MVKIRLARAGAKKHPIYHVVVAEKSKPRDGRFVESLGLYDPTATPHVLKLDVERIQSWLKKGATPTETVKRLIKQALKAQPAANA